MGHHSDVDCVRFHPNCHYLATGSRYVDLLMTLHLGGTFCRCLSINTVSVIGRSDYGISKLEIVFEFFLVILTVLER